MFSNVLSFVDYCHKLAITSNVIAFLGEFLLICLIFTLKLNLMPETVITSYTESSME